MRNTIDGCKRVIDRLTQQLPPTRSYKPVQARLKGGLCIPRLIYGVQMENNVVKAYGCAFKHHSSLYNEWISEDHVSEKIMSPQTNWFPKVKKFKELLMANWDQLHVIPGENSTEFRFLHAQDAKDISDREFLSLHNIEPIMTTQLPTLQLKRTSIHEGTSPDEQKMINLAEAIFRDQGENIRHCLIRSRVEFLLHTRTLIIDGHHFGISFYEMKKHLAQFVVSNTGTFNKDTDISQSISFKDLNNIVLRCTDKSCKESMI